MSGVDIDSIADELLAADRTGKTLPLTITYAASIASRSAGQGTAPVSTSSPR
jgi:hypothetical protein